MYDYGVTGRDLAPDDDDFEGGEMGDGDGGGEFGEGFEDEQYYREEAADEDIDFRGDYKQMQQMIGDKGRGTTVAPSLGKKGQKAMRTPEEVLIDQLRGVLSSAVYADISETKKNSIVEEAEKVPNATQLNLELLVPALLWKQSKFTLTKDSFSKFTVRYSIVDVISFLRYIRMLSS